MRQAFVKAITASARRKEKIHLLTGDLGFQVFEPFKEKFPNQFTNAGVAEADMASIAAGMAHSGLTCICYSISPFLVFRALEQIRNDICYHNLNVKIVGVGGGFSYSYSGQSHCAIEDIAVMRSLPNMTVICPGDPLETYSATTEMLKIKGPVYLRLGKVGEPTLTYEQIGKFQIGKAVEIQKGSDLVIISIGNMLETAAKVVEELERKNLTPTHIHIHTVKPLDKEKISEILETHTKIVTIEEHSVIGGLGGAVAEANCSAKSPRQILALGIEDKYFDVAGTQNYFRKLAGLDVDTVVNKINEKFGL